MLLLKRLALIAVALVASLALLELATRAVLRLDRVAVAERLRHQAGEVEAAPRPQALEDQRVMLHPYFGYVVDPRAPGINAFGFFRDPPLTTRAADRLVVAIFGGSVADQIFVLGQPALVAALQAHPPFAGRRIELLSTALGGYKQPQQLLVLAGLLALGAQFDVVINLDGFNEIDGAADNVQDGVNPYFPHNWHLHARQGLDPESAALLGRMALAREARAALRERFAAWPVEHSAVLLALWEGLDRRHLAALRAASAALDARLATQAHGPQVSGPPVEFADSEGMFVDFVEVWARASLAMSNLCRGQGIQYFHFLQPNQYFEGSKVLTDEERRLAWDADVAEAGRVATAYPLLVERGRQLAAQGVEFVDLTQLFLAEEGTIYADACCHYNARGAGLVGDAIAQSIVAAN